MSNTQPTAPRPLSLSESQGDLVAPPDSGVVAAPPEAPPTRLPWIPIRSLAQRQRERILEHLCALAPRDRYLRFGFQADDIQIGRYVDSLDFDRDEIFGVFNRRLELVALAHLAYPPEGRKGPGQDAAEFGVSVLAKQRGRGYGARLFEHAMLHARNRGLGTIFIHALSENMPMLRIARQAGATVHRDGPESDAYLELPPETMASRLEQAVSGSVAEFDYRVKQQARMVDSVIDVINEVRTGIRDAESSQTE